MKRVFGAAIALALSACGSREVYAPTTTTSAELAGSPSMTYSIPSVAPRGDVRLASYGLARSGGPGGPRVRIGMAISNRSNETWSIDAREQRLALASGTSVLPDAPERVTIPPHSTRFVELVYPLELVVARDDDIPTFTVGWVVHAGATIVAGSTPFAARAKP